MATLTVWKFDTEGGADTAAATLLDLTRRHVVTVRDAATVTWPVGSRKPRTRQLTGLTPAGGMGGAFWGLLFGLIFFVPLLGAAIGAATGALSVSLADVGIDDTFMNRARDQITPGTSALFLLSSEAVIEAVREALGRHAPAELLFTHLTREQEDALREVFSE